MKYKKGDKVVIKPWGLMEKEYGLGNEGQIRAGIRRWTEHYEQCIKGSDRSYEIYTVADDYYFIEIPDCRSCHITDEMILGHAFAWGEKIEVRDGDGQDWVRERFCAYLPGRKLPVVCLRDDSNHARYWFARPIRKPEIELTCKINGELRPLSDISEETLLKIRKGE